MQEQPTNAIILISIWNKQTLLTATSSRHEGKRDLTMNLKKTKPPTSLHAETETEEQGFLLQPSKIQVGEAYTVRIDYDQQENQIVNVRTFGKIDLAKIKLELQRAFPEAQIRQEPRTITVSKKNIKKTKPNKKHT